MMIVMQWAAAYELVPGIDHEVPVEHLRVMVIDVCSKSVDFDVGACGTDLVGVYST